MQKLNESYKYSQVANRQIELTSFSSCWTEAVHLVKENDAWRSVLGLLEEFAEISFSLPNKHVEAVCPLSQKEGHRVFRVSVHFRSEGFCEQGFSSAGRSMEDYAYK